MCRERSYGDSARALQGVERCRAWQPGLLPGLPLRRCDRRFCILPTTGYELPKSRISAPKSGKLPPPIRGTPERQDENLERRPHLERIQGSKRKAILVGYRITITSSCSHSVPSSCAAGLTRRGNRPPRVAQGCQASDSLFWIYDTISLWRDSAPRSFRRSAESLPLLLLRFLSFGIS